VCTMSETETFWKDRYEAVQDEYHLIQKENEYLFWTIKKIKMQVAAGDVVDALVQIGDIIQRSHEVVSKTRKDKTGGYLWNQR